MKKSKYVELNFRYRPKEGTQDAILVKFLNSCPPRSRKRMILTALRRMYMIDALSELGEIESFQELSQVVQNLKQIYSQEKLNKTLSLEISVWQPSGDFLCDNFLEDGSRDLSEDERFESGFDELD